MPSPDVLRHLIAKELRELAASRAYWLMLLVAGALVGHAFLTSTTLYVEVSGGGGGPSALSQGLSPLTGIVVPVLGVYDLVSTLLFPFVVIRTFASEREDGVLPVLLQAPVSFGWMMSCKAIALLLGWIVAGLPAITALAWWRMVGGHLNGAETMTVAGGHLLRGVFTIGIGAAASAFGASAASAAIIALSVTLGAWAIDYAAAAKGGWFQMVAAYTPTSALRVFEQGEVRLSIVLVLVTLGMAGVALAWQWLRVGLSVARRATGVALLAVSAMVLCAAEASVRPSYDLSEDRRNSFSAADERALRTIRTPLHVIAYLAAEDPRLADLERGVFAKLRRTLPHVSVSYVSRGQSGLFAASGEHYGEVWYEIDGRRAMSRSATEEIVLETVYGVAGVPIPTQGTARSYPGYPLTRAPSHPGLLFFVVWPLAVLFTWWWTQRPSVVRIRE